MKILIGIALIMIVIAYRMWATRTRRKVEDQLKQNATDIEAVLERYPDLKERFAADPKVTRALKTMKGE
ncbi:MAG TPA: hypothetical protein VI431_06270 [Candidatus Acidoferrum sp.]